MKYSNYPVKINGQLCKQINKKTAAKLYAKGLPIFLHPCNMTLNNMWQSPFEISLDHEELKSKIEWAKKCEENNWPLEYTPAITPELQFKDRLFNYETYNCVHELGKYANCFAPIK